VRNWFHTESERRAGLVSQIQAKKRGPGFKKGMSGGPVYDGAGRVVGISRVLENLEKEKHSDMRSNFP